jgi:flavin reductase (DIM6/NTAB) family NADH-FMN oxidoreductase RutF
MCYISVRPERHSYDIIKRNMAFVINLTNEDMARATDWAGVRSGKDYDKFKETGLTPLKADMVDAPIVAESPLSIECRVKEIVPLGSLDMFIAEVVNVQADERFIDADTGEFQLDKAKLMAYSHGHYYALGEEIGHFGWSVRKKK